MTAVAVATLDACEFKCTYPATAKHVGRVRHLLAEFLGACPRADDAGLVASELLTNSLQHSESGDGGAFSFEATLSRRLILLEVTDQGGPWKRMAGLWEGGGTPDAEGEDGRGLFMVALLAGGSHNCGVVDSVTGSRSVWARLYL